MTNPSPTPTVAQFIAGDPGRLIRCWVAGFLRLSIGLSLLGSGLRGYFAHQNPAFANRFGQSIVLAGLDPFLSSMPYLSIALGLALIVGFLNTAASIAAAFLTLLPIVLSILQTVATMGNQGGGPRMFLGGLEDPMSMFGVFTVIPHALTIWMSPLQNHPISLDALIFGPRTAPGAFPPAPITTGEPDPSPTTEPNPTHSSG